MAPPLLPSQKNECFRALERGGLDPAAFRWGELTVRNGSIVPALIHSATDFYFGFGGRGGGGDFMIYFSPDPRGYGWDPSGSWGAVTSWFNKWVKDLRYELDDGDLWRDLVANRTSLAAYSEDNSTFTTEERGRLAETLGRVEEQIRSSQQLSKEQTQVLHKSFQLMRETSERMGRKDWQLYALGTLTSLAISAAFAPDQARTIVHNLVNALA